MDTGLGYIGEGATDKARHASWKTHPAAGTKQALPKLPTEISDKLSPAESALARTFWIEIQRARASLHRIDEQLREAELVKSKALGSILALRALYSATHGAFVESEPTEDELDVGRAMMLPGSMW